MKLTSTTVDATALVRLIRGTESEIRPLKRALRTTWSEPMGSAQQRLHALRRQATLLYILRAHLRGKHHLNHQPREHLGLEWPPARYHREMAERAADRFRLVRPAGDQP